ncbi:MAG: hypothetical protein GX549_06310 [Clostridiales bacterium]|nr:hypothetical protein [Clostridiales bacterium]
MRAIRADMRRALTGIWFPISVVATVACLWMDLGEDSYWLLRGGGMEPMTLFAEALAGAGSALALPILAALPAAGAALRELSAGAARMAVFRCGRGAYIAGKLLAVLLAATLSQSAGCFAFAGLLLMLCPAPAAAFPASILLNRLLSAMVFSLIGGVGALLTDDPVSACTVPTAASFALTMLSSRFLIGVRYVSPLSWLSGDSDALTLLIALIAAASALYAVVLRRELGRHA